MPATASMFVFPLPTVTGYGFGSGIALNERQVEKLSQIAKVAETRMRYDEDFNYLQVLMARQSLLDASLSLLENQYELVEAHILLFKFRKLLNSFQHRVFTRGPRNTEEHFFVYQVEMVRGA